MFSYIVRGQRLSPLKTFLTHSVVGFCLIYGALASAASWKFEDLSTPADPNGACIIYVDSSVGKTELRLQIARAKGGIGPAEVFIRETKVVSAAKTWIITAAFASQPFGLAEVSNTGRDRTFWHLPVNTQFIVNHLVADQEVSIKATGVTKEIKASFSRKGFSTALREIQTKCLGGQPLVDLTYEQNFIQNVIVGGDLQNITQAEVVRLRELYHLGYQTYLAQKVNDQKINQIFSRYQPEIDKFSQVTARIQVLTQTEIPNLQNAIAQQKTNRTRAEVELKRVQAVIPDLEATVVRDQATLTRARAARAPYELENDRLQERLDSSDSNLRLAQNYLYRVQSDIARTNSNLSEAENELNSLLNAQSRLYNQARQAEYDLREARRSRDDFDADREIRRRTAGNARLQQKQNEVQVLQNQANQSQIQVGRTQNQLLRAKEALSQCQAVVGSDCASQMVAVQGAQANYDQAISQLQVVQDQLNSAQRELQKIISHIENEVRDEEERLTRRVDRVVDELDQIRRELDLVNDRARDLEVSVIPNLNRDLRTLEADQRRAQNDVAEWQSSVRSATAELEAYRSRVGWSGKTAAISEAIDKLSRSTNNRDEAYANKLRQEKIISDSNVKQKNFEAELLERTNELVQARVRQADLQPIVDKYRAERAPLDVESSRLNQLLIAYQTEYKGIVETL